MQLTWVEMCDVGRATGAASLSWVLKYELTLSQFKMTMKAVLLAQCPVCSRCSVKSFPSGLVQALLPPAAGSWVSDDHLPHPLLAHHQKKWGSFEELSS